jgi:hypothetical protein
MTPFHAAALVRVDFTEGSYEYAKQVSDCCPPAREHERLSLPRLGKYLCRCVID